MRAASVLSTLGDEDAARRAATSGLQHLTANGSIVDAARTAEALAELNNRAPAPARAAAVEAELHSGARAAA